MDYSWVTDKMFDDKLKDIVNSSSDIYEPIKEHFNNQVLEELEEERELEVVDAETMKFPYKCTRCGFCCLNETCPMGMLIYNIGKHAPCPALKFYGDTAACMAPLGTVPFGDGCCIKARCYKDGKEYDFAALPAALKVNVVRSKRMNVAMGRWKIGTENND